eukprot:3201961-Pleurochrysis_carterae.AAC.2
MVVEARADGFLPGGETMPCALPDYMTPWQFEETGRGLRCLRAVREGEILAAAPLSECWSADAALAASEMCEVLAALQARNVRLPEHALIALHILVEKSRGALSPRAAHVSQLPTQFDSTLFWTDSEISSLQGSVWYTLAMHERRAVEDEYAVIHGALHSKTFYSVLKEADAGSAGDSVNGVRSANGGSASENTGPDAANGVANSAAIGTADSSNVKRGDEVTSTQTLDEKYGLTWDSYRWAYAAVHSRWAQVSLTHD